MKCLMFSLMLALAAAQAPCSTPGCPVFLGTSGDFVILSKSGISTVPPSVVTGDIGVSPIATTAMTGFSVTAHSSGTYSLSTQVVGKMYAADNTPPTPSKMTTAVSDMETAYTDAASRATSGPPDASNPQVYLSLGAGDITGQTLAPGVYTWDTNIVFSNSITFAGTDTDVFILRTTGNVVAATGANVVLQSGAKAENIFWQAAGFLDVGAGAHLEGVFLVKTHAIFKTGSSINGRILVQTACVLQSTTVGEPRAI